MAVKPIDQRAELPHIPHPVAGAGQCLGGIALTVDQVSVEGETFRPPGLDADQTEPTVFHQIPDEAMSQQVEFTRAVGSLADGDDASIVDHVREWTEVSIERHGIDGFQGTDMCVQGAEG
jgi:hypothetical protein